MSRVIWLVAFDCDHIPCGWSYIDGVNK